MRESGPVRIAVADDHEVVRDGLAELLNTQADFTVRDHMRHDQPPTSYALVRGYFEW